MRRLFQWPLWGILATLLSVAAFANAADAGKTSGELRKIDALLDSVKSSNVTFIRNGSEYTAPEAHEHLRKKLKSAQNSWFAPPKDQWTARLFIEKVASRSSISGKPYLVRFKDGKVLEARAWLTEMLRTLEATDGKP
jgi:hypothetical protein